MVHGEVRFEANQHTSLGFCRFLLRLNTLSLLSCVRLAFPLISELKARLIGASRCEPLPGGADGDFVYIYVYWGEPERAPT